MADIERHARLAALFDAVVDLDVAERDRVLAEACAGDDALRRDLETLLNCDATGSRLDQVLAGNAASRRAVALATAPQRIGPYRILDVLGEGGLSIVYLAEQTEPVVRHVALKMLKPGMDSLAILNRFEAERLTLARMAHSGIAQVFDAGATPQGHPYFVMERVEGEPITPFCDRWRLDVHARIRLMIAVCEAVQHAHEKGVIHRDIKPSNVLVTWQDGRPQPKVIDFGIAKALAAASATAGGDAGTQAGQVIGTPRYMSPEQAAGGGTHLDTRSDVYALGMMLYELLVGRLPTDAADDREPARGDALAGVGGDDWSVRPSQCFRRQQREQHDIARLRGTRPAVLQKLLQGDLDWIVGRAVATERSDRYESASALARDLTRYLEHLPVEARPPGTAYLLRRLFRRHRTVVIASMMIVFAMIAGLVAMSVGLERALRAERVAEQARADAAAAAVAARAQADTSQRVTDFLVQLFRVSDPRQARGDEVTARELLDRAAQQLATGLGEEPDVRATLLDTMGQAYMQLGLFDDAEQLLAPALEIRRQRAGGSDAVAKSLRSMGLLRYYQGRFDEAEQLHRSALEINRSVHGEISVDVAANLHNLGSAIDQQGDWAGAEVLLTRSLEMRTQLLGDEHEDVARTLNNLAAVVRRQGRTEEAIALLERALAIHDTLWGEHHPEAATVLANLGAAHTDLRQFEAAERLQRRALDVQQRILGEAHPMTLSTMSNLAVVLARRGAMAEAETLARESYALHRIGWGQDHLNTAHSASSLGVLLHQVGRDRESVAILNEALGIYRSAVGEAHPRAALARIDLANAMIDLERAAEATPLAADASAALAATLPAGHPWLALADSVHGAALIASGQRVEEGERLLRDALPLLQQYFGADSARTREAIRRLAR
jgi:serine/threonine protein kinase/Tfp pilus assembly protein PilF